MRSFSGIRLRRTVIISSLSSLAIVLAATLAACGGVSAANGSTNSTGSTGASSTSGGCKDDFETDLVRSDQIAGHIRYLMAFANNGSSTCTVEGYPVVTVNDSSITVATTTTTGTWSNVAIEPLTLSPNGFVFFAIQGRDETTNCKFVSPTVAPSKNAKGALSSAVITICGGELLVSPFVSDAEMFTQ